MIVGVEANRDGLQVFIQEANGTVRAERREHEYWLLSPIQHDESWLPLNGQGHFKYKKRFTNKAAWWADYRQNPGVYAVFCDKEAALISHNLNYFQNLKPQELGTLAFDIETMGLEHDDEAKVLLISNTFRRGDNYERKLFAFDEYPNQARLLEAWCAWVREVDPSIVVGHNIYGYDLPYLAHVALLNQIELRLGRFGKPLELPDYESKFRKDGSQFYSYKNPHIYGREVIDTMFLAMKADVGRKYASYGLKSIIREEGLERTDRVHVDASKIYEDHKDPVKWAQIKAYAEHDADDALNLYFLHCEPYFYLCRTIPKPYQAIINGASGAQINSWMVREYLKNSHSLPDDSPAVEYEGALSGANPGLYRNILKVDVASLYPSIMLEWRVFDEKKDPKGLFLGLVERLTKERLDNKAKHKATGDPYFKAMSEAQKVVINSCYGFLGAPGLLFNSSEKAAFVTAKGREILQKALEWCKNKGFTIVNYDTDSVSFSDRGKPMSAERQQELLSELNALFPARIRWEHDGYYESGLMVKAKNYALRSGTKTKIKGAALKATSKEPALREYLSRCVEALLTEESPNLDKIFSEYEAEIQNVTDIRRWCSKKTITSKVLAPARTQERNILEALAGAAAREGDKIHVYYLDNKKLKLAKHYNGDHCKKILLTKLKNTRKIIGGLNVQNKKY